MSDRRWVCPNECGLPGANAPGRMRKDDWRRICPRCSESTGRVVYRVCPSLERGRAEARSRVAEKEKRRRASVAHLVHARKSLRRALRLKTFSREGVKLRADWLKILNGEGDEAFGRAGWTGWVRIGPTCSEEWAAIVIIHELVHITLERSGKVDARHDRRFQGLHLSACCEYFGLDEALVIERWGGTRRWENRAYNLDRAVQSLVREER